MDQNQPMQQPSQPAPDMPKKGGAMGWIIALVVVIVIAVVVWLLVK
jgi:hypothetical protein